MCERSNSYSQDYPIKFLIRRLSNMVEPDTMSYSIDYAKYGEITNLPSSVFPAELTMASWFPLHPVHVWQPITQTSLVWGTNAYSIHLRVHLHNYSGTTHHFTGLTMPRLNS